MELPYAPKFDEFLKSKGHLEAEALELRSKEIMPLNTKFVQGVLDLMDEEEKERMLAIFSKPIKHFTFRYPITINDICIGEYKVEGRGNEIIHQQFNGVIPGYINPYTNTSIVGLLFRPPDETSEGKRIDGHNLIPFP